MTGNMNSVLFLVEMLYRFNNQCNAEIFTLRNDEMNEAKGTSFTLSKPNLVKL